MIYRIDVQNNSLERLDKESSVDPVGQSLRRQIAAFTSDPGPITTSRIYLIDTDADRVGMQRVADELLADAIVERATVMDANSTASTDCRIEIHLKPGVMDPVAASTAMAIRDLGLTVREVRTGRAYQFSRPLDRAALSLIAARVLANGVIESIHFERFIPRRFERGHSSQFVLRHVPVRDLSEDQLARLSRDGHLFLSPAEMNAIQAYYREQGREPTDIELETIAQTWSEHCVHKTLKSAVNLEVRETSGAVVERRTYRNLIKETIFASTKQLMTEDRAHFCLSVFVDNAGVIAFDESDAVCFKVETHNHPSAIEPYGGSATGIGGVTRDILGTGLGARPFANTDIFCVAYADRGNEPMLPKGVIHPKRVLQQVVAGVRDYGNRMGIPTVNGAVYFDDRYLGNPLIFCGCVGLLPRNRIAKEARRGDAIVLIGGRTGRDGIHGATFSSAELTDTHADEFSHAVQIGNAITEKKMADVVLQARDRELFTAITDCGAGGLSSAIGEMGEKIGARVELDMAPLKYDGLRYDEIWISEAQERMVLSVEPQKLKSLLQLAEEEDVEATVIGEFGVEQEELILRFHGHEVGRLTMDFLHHGLPMPSRLAVVSRDAEAKKDSLSAGTVRENLLQRLAHPNIASKHWIIRQYDHEVQGGSVIKPLVGPMQIGPSDAAVMRPKLSSQRAVVLGCGLAPQVVDPYEMTLWAVDEAVRNLVAVGADPDRIAFLDNFCWPSVDDEKTMGTLVRACEACRDAALAYRIPFISGKDSLHNQFTNQETGQVLRIPNTLLISAIGIVDDARRCITMDLKSEKDVLLLVEPSRGSAASPAERAALSRALARVIAAGQVLSCHDVSDGGLLVALAEQCIASGKGIVMMADFDHDGLFMEMPGRYVIEIAAGHESWDRVETQLRKDANVTYLGDVSDSPELMLARHREMIHVPEMLDVWRGTLDW